MDKNKLKSQANEWLDDLQDKARSSLAGGEQGSSLNGGMNSSLNRPGLSDSLSSFGADFSPSDLSIDSLKESAMGALNQATGKMMGRLFEAPLCRFFVDVAGMGEEAFAVECFKSHDYGLSSLAVFDVDVLVRVLPGLEALYGETAQLRICANGGRDCVIPLQVEAVEELSASPEGKRLRLQLVSPLFQLSHNRHNRVFLNLTLEEIIQQVMTDAGYNADSLDIEFSQAQPARAMVVQYEESDMDFLSRLLARDGAFYTVQASSQGGRFLFYDDSQTLAETLGVTRLDYHRESGQTSGSERVFQVSRTLRRMTGKVTLRDQNPETPDCPPHGDAESDGEHGCHEHWGTNSVDNDQAKALATVRAQSLAVERQTVIASADTGQLQPGMRLALNGHPDYSGDWLVVSVSVQGDQRVGHAFGQNSDRPGLLSELSLIPIAQPYRSAGSWQRAPVHSTFSAVVEGDGSGYAYLDDQGRYRVRLPFDLSDAEDGEASPPVRLMQPYGGPDSGMHLPLHAGTEVLLSCVNGDIDRPIILGALSNPNTPSPVTNANPSQHILRTRGGNELLMEDRTGNERIELFTSERKNRLSLDAKENAHQVTLESLEGDMQLTAGNHMTVEVGGSQNVQVGEDKTVNVTRNLRLMTEEGEVELLAGTDLLFKAKDNLRLSADNGDIDLHAGQDLITHSEGDTSMDVINGDVNVVVGKGSLGVDVSGSITFRGAGNAPLRMSQGGGMIEISPSGDLIIDGNAVEISGGTIKVDGQQVGSN